VADVELVLLVVLVGGITLVAIAPALHVPYPVLLLAGGCALGFVPGMPEIAVSPDVVLLGILPPLLYSAAFTFPLRQFRHNARPIGLLAVVVVVLTMLAVGAAGHLVLGLDWGVAFVLGAVVSPTDPIAVEAIARGVKIPRRLVSIIQGESLINDATALTLFASAVAFVVDGSVSAPAVAGTFLLAVGAGVAVGLAVGWLAIHARGRLDSAPEELALSLLSCYASYLGAELVHGSGVLAVVVCGAYHGWRQHTFISPATRLRTTSFWTMLAFLTSGALIVLVGLQAARVLGELGSRSTGKLILGAAVVTAAVVLVRVAWVALSHGVLRVAERAGPRELALPRGYPMVVAATGMRGAVSLAAALAIPMQTAAGDPFPERDLLIFLAFAVIVGTLVPQGLALGWLLRRLNLDEDEDTEREELEARLEVARAARERLEELRGEEWVRDATADQLEELFDHREERYGAQLREEESDAQKRTEDFARLRRELLESERDALVRMRDEGRIDGDVLRRVEFDLDLEDNRLDESVPQEG
jgi:CPA1 family monovalent cation:H+ antiporter